MKALFIAFAFVVSAQALSLAAGYEQGVQLYNQRNYQAALNAFEGAQLTNTQSDGNIFYYMGMCFRQLGQSEKARQCFERVLVTYPRSQAAGYAQQAIGSLGGGGSHSSGASNAQISALINNVLGSSRSGSSSGAANNYGTTEGPSTANIPFQRGNGGHMMVNALVNGHPLQMIFDTGAENVSLGKEHLAQLGIEQPTGPPRGKMMGTSGAVPLWIMPLTIQAGDLKRTIPVAVAEHLSTPPLIGQMFFKDYTCSVDSASGIVRLSKGGSSQGGYDAIKVPFSTSGQELIVDAEIDGHSTKCIFDTGASGVVLTMTQAAAMGLQIPDYAQDTGTTGVGGNKSGKMFNVRTVRLGSVVKNNVPVLVLQGTMPYPLLGQTVFRDRNFSIDNANRVIRFPR